MGDGGRICKMMGLKANDEKGNGRWEVAVCNIWGTPRILDFWSPPIERKAESKELCEKFIKMYQATMPKIIEATLRK